MRAQLNLHELIMFTTLLTLKMAHSTSLGSLCKTTFVLIEDDCCILFGGFDEIVSHSLPFPS